MACSLRRYFFFPMTIYLPRFAWRCVEVAVTIALVGSPFSGFAVSAESATLVQSAAQSEPGLSPPSTEPTTPNEAMGYIRRGLILARTGDYQQAIEQFTLAIELDPNLGLAYGNRGFTRVAVGDNAGAIEDFTRALELDPEDAIMFASRGITYAEMGDNETALVDLNRSIEINPDFAPTYYNRGLTRMALEDAQGALEDLTRAIDLDADFAAAYRTRGQLRSDLDDTEGAIEDLQTAAELFRAQRNTQGYREVMNELEQLQQGESPQDESQSDE
jgi:tetratricopeptide (TPR) repeat protein